NKELIFREARNAAALHHPNIATIFEVHDTPDAAFLVMELIEGESLRARIDRGVMPLGEAFAIARQIAVGMGRAHRAGIVHQDRKPENVMCSTDGPIKLLDFGLATMDGRSHAGEGRIAGTLAYMAPEQARGEPVDARTDVFAFGVVLYELVTGTQPF